MILTMLDVLVQLIDAAGLFACYGLISFFSTRREFWGFQALLIVFWAFFLGFAWLLVGDVARMAGFSDLSAIWLNPLRSTVYRVIVVCGLWIGNLWLRRRWQRQ